MTSETTETAVVNGAAHVEPKGPGVKKAKPRKTKAKATARSGARAKTKSPARATAKRKPSKGRGTKRGKRSGKVPGHWSKTHAQLVLHATPELVAKLDRKIKALGKSLKLDKPTRGSVLRALVERACK